MIPIAEFYDENMNELIRELHPDFILDCIDSIKSKKDLIQLALNEEIPIISSMGMARKKDPSQIEVCEVEKTSYDPIAKNIRIWKRKNKIRKKSWWPVRRKNQWIWNRVLFFHLRFLFQPRQGC